METQGTIKKINDVVKISETFSKVEFLLITDEETAYPQSIQFCITNDRIEKLAPFNVGDFVKVHFSVRGKEYKNDEGKETNINTLDVFRITKL